MPGRYVHMTVCRRALGPELETNPRAAERFALPGPRPAELTTIGRENPAYAALGAIGPDLFFLLPDWKPPGGWAMWGIFRILELHYDLEELAEPFEELDDEITWNAQELEDAWTGGLARQRRTRKQRRMELIFELLQAALVSQWDVWGTTSSSVAQGCDEQGFSWSDMLHYRRTYQLAHNLWLGAFDEPDPVKRAHFQAYALGWMTHLATDVTGHAFVNEKCGGPYRTHWARHTLVENHMDAFVYRLEHGGDALYRTLASSALHLSIAFEPNGMSLHPAPHPPQPGYDPSSKPRGFRSRARVWSADSDLPDHLADFLAQTLRKTYDGASGDALGQLADHPKILNTYEGGDGYPTRADLKATYHHVYHFVRMQTTDH